MAAADNRKAAKVKYRAQTIGLPKNIVSTVDVSENILMEVERFRRNPVYLSLEVSFHLILILSFNSFDRPLTIFPYERSEFRASSSLVYEQSPR